MATYTKRQKANGQVERGYRCDAGAGHLHQTRAAAEACETRTAVTSRRAARRTNKAELMAVRLGQAVAALTAAQNDVKEARKAATNDAWGSTLDAYLERITYTLEGDGLGTGSGLVDTWVKATNEVRDGR